MNHPCKDCPNFTDGKCCHETKICLSNSAKNETQADLSVESGSREFLKGDVVIFKAADELDNLFTIIDLMVLDDKDFANLEAEYFYHDGYLNELRHATLAEIKAGHRIDKSSLDELMDSALKSREQARESAVALKEEAHKHFGGGQ